MLVNNTHVSFEPTTHTYLNAEWEELIGVTTLMRKHDLSPSYDGIAANVLAKAAARGSAIHKEIEDYCNGVITDNPMSDECKNFIDMALEVAASEYLVSDNTTVATMIDIVLADYSLADIKTTSTFHRNAVSWQLSICAYLFELQNPTIKAGKLYGIHLRDSKAKLIEVERKPSSVIEQLIECERWGEIFDQSF